MEQPLQKIILDYQNNIPEAFETIYQKFLPSLLKYSNRFCDSDEAFDTIMHTFVLSLYRMPINQPQFQHDGVIVSYIKTTIQNAYYALCKEERKKTGNTCSYEERVIDIPDASNQEDNTIFLLALKPYLTSEELKIIYWKYYLCLQESEMAKRYGISRQAINKKLHQILKKLREVYKKEVNE